ncbi:hypothetical protein Tco_0206345 [Tanacetum coccineum]
MLLLSNVMVNAPPIKISPCVIPLRFIIMPTTRSGMTPEAIEELIAQRVAKALVAHEANRNIENIIEIGDENEDENKGDNGNGNGGGNSNGHGDGNGNGNG